MLADEGTMDMEDMEGVTRPLTEIEVIEEPLKSEESDMASICIVWPTNAVRMWSTITVRKRIL